VKQEAMREPRKVYLFDKDKALHQLYEEQQKIYQAIEQQDSDKAVQQMKSHLAEVRDTILENIRQK
ncbi:FadR family transcriptional regulator, partial [Staphylococcus nepalensis]